VEGDKGDASRGAPIFEKNCAGCHRLFGQGETIGPELTGSERSNLDFLLESLVAPSAVIRKEYQPMTVATTDGRVLNGLIVEESDAAVTLFDSNKERTVIPRDQIEAMKPSAVSVMPEGLLDNLLDEQARDLFRYLQSSGPPR
jgi:putative heme-binding domain-containing protein